jgi:hypothetical protein
MTKSVISQITDYSFSHEPKVLVFQQKPTVACEKPAHFQYPGLATVLAADVFVSSHAQLSVRHSCGGAAAH